MSDRVRFAKDQLLRALTAMENIDSDTLTDGIRTLELEDRVRDLTEQCARWRRLYETTHDLLSGHPDAQKRDQELREWVAKA